MVAIIIGVMLVAVVMILGIKTWMDNGCRLSEAEKEAELKYWWKGVRNETSKKT